MTELLPFLKQMITLPGLSGYETPIRRLIETTWQPLTDELGVSRLGSLHGLRRGALPAPRPSVLVSTHMDAIGMMVTEIVDEFLGVTQIGGIDQRVLAGQLVTVHSSQGAGADGTSSDGDLPGVIVPTPDRLLPPSQRDSPAPMEKHWVDTGLPANRLKTLVQVGDLVSFAQLPLETSGETLVGHSLDNRASVAALTYCLDLLRSRPLAWDVWAVASVQEEETLGGALTSAYQLRPTLAIAVDVTFASGPGSPSHKTYPLGKGVTLGWGPNVHPGLYNAFKSLAEKMEIPHVMEAMPRHSGTDAFGLQVTAEGIPSMVISIPLRYMHTPVEMVSMKDVTRAGRLLAEFIAQLDEKFMEKLAWPEDGGR